MHEEVPKEEAAVQPVRALEKRHGDRNLAVGRHQKPKKRALGDGAFWKKLAAARRGVICRARVAWHKGHGRQGKVKTRLQDKALKDRRL
jgi:hypothetical protein